MSVEIVDKGKNNLVELHPWFEKNGQIKITFSGNNNRVVIAHPPINCLHTIIEMGHDSLLQAGEACNLSNSFFFCTKSCEIVIGSQATFTSRARLLMHEPSRITIGDDCMIAADVQLMTSDCHSILDLTTRERINFAENIDIGDHVWIGLQAMILKGAKIGTGSVVGMRSVVTGTVPDHSLVAGCPARVVRENVDWDRRLLKTLNWSHVV